MKDIFAVVSEVEKVLEMMTQTTHTNLDIIFDPNILLIESYERMKEAGATIFRQSIYFLSD